MYKTETRAFLGIISKLVLPISIHKSLTDKYQPKMESVKKKSTWCLCLLALLISSEFRPVITATPEFGTNLTLSSVNTTAETEGLGSVNETLVTETTALIQAGDSEIQFSNKHKKVILVLGVTGAGKTTMTQLISGNNSAMISYETVHGSENYLIKDSRKLISEANVVSKTIFPILVIDNETNEALYDCPGFADTRSVPIEIANTYFIKRIVDNHDAIKILLVVNYDSVRPGYNRYQFLLLIDYLLQFLVEPGMFDRSIAMVVTKVNTRQSDSGVITTVVEFLQRLEQEIQEVDLKHPIDKVNRIISIFLNKVKDKYPNIQIFRQPEAPGPISDIVSVQENRQRIREMVFHNTFFQYQHIGTTSFGFSLSTKAHLVILSLLHKSKDLTDDLLKNLRRNLTNGYEVYVRNQESLIETQSNFLNFQNVLTEYNRNQNASYLLYAYQEAMNRTGIRPPQDLFKNVENSLQFMRFLESMRGKNASSDHVIGKVSTNLFQNLVSATEDFGVLNLQRFCQALPLQLLSFHDSQLEKFDSYEAMQAEVHRTVEDLEQLLQDINNLPIPGILKRIGNQTLAGTSFSNIGAAAAVLGFARSCAKFHEQFSSSYTLLDSRSGALNHEPLVKMVTTFLEGIQTYSRLFDRVDSVLNAWMTGDWNSASFKQVMDIKMSNDFTKRKIIAELEALKDLEASLTLKEGSVQVVEGHVISTTEVQRLLSTTYTAKCVVLMASKVIKIDADLVTPGTTLFLFAPKILVVGARKISVDGIPGQTYENSAAEGKAGAQGRPGGIGGSIIISGLEIQIVDTLTLSSNGGQGGRGQDGGNGLKGANGENLEGNEVERAGMEDIKVPYSVEKKECCKNDYYEQQLKRNPELAKNPIFQFSKLFGQCYASCSHFWAMGSPGSGGYNGNRGGTGGEGGSAGNIELFFPNGEVSEKIRRSMKSGLPGNGGKGGQGGAGGTRGNGLSVWRFHDSYRKKTAEGAAWGSFVPVVGTIIGAIVGSTIHERVEGELKILETISFAHDRASFGLMGPSGSPGPSSLHYGSNNSCSARTIQVHNNYINFLTRNRKNLFLRSTVQKYLKSPPLR